MITFKDFIDYFESLAEKHTMIDHKQSGQVSFFNVDMVDLFAGIKSSIVSDKYSMVIVNYNSVLNQVSPGEKDINFFILKSQEKGDVDANVAIRSEAETIAQEIIAKIQQDCTAQPRDVTLTKMFRGSMDRIENVDIIHTEIYAAGQKLIGVQCSFSNKFIYCPTIRPNIFRP